MDNKQNNAGQGQPGEKNQADRNKQAEQQGTKPAIQPGEKSQDDRSKQAEQQSGTKPASGQQGEGSDKGQRDPS